MRLVSSSKVLLLMRIGKTEIVRVEIGYSLSFLVCIANESGLPVGEGEKEENERGADQVTGNAHVRC